MGRLGKTAKSAVEVRTSGLERRPIAAAEVRRRAERMLLALGLDRAELSVLLCDDRTIHALNRDYRRKDEPTDVLAFAMRDGEAGDLHPDVLGDVVISIDTARRQAGEAGRSLSDEITMLLAHGLLHLLGYDHRTRAEERRMNARADLLIAASRSAGGAAAKARKRRERTKKARVPS